VEEDTECLGFLQRTKNLDTILEDRPPLTVNRVCHDSSGDKMVWMKNDHVVDIINNALA